MLSNPSASTCRATPLGRRALEIGSCFGRGGLRLLAHADCRFVVLGLPERVRSELGAREVSLCDPRSLQLGSVEVGTFQSGAAKIRVPQVGVCQVGSAKIRVAQIRSVRQRRIEPRARQRGTSQEGPLERAPPFGTDEAGATKINSLEVLSAEPGHVDAVPRHAVVVRIRKVECWELTVAFWEIARITSHLIED